MPQTPSKVSLVPREDEDDSVVPVAEVTSVNWTDGTVNEADPIVSYKINDTREKSYCKILWISKNLFHF